MSDLGIALSGYCDPECGSNGPICDFCQYFYNLTAWHEGEETCECNDAPRRLAGWCVHHNRETGVTDACGNYLCFRLARVEGAAPEHGTPESAALVARIREE